ncbi:MAG TPA: DegT/DnrJ/EryC1/StrS family aminotransferase [Planctomycetota bacterium]|nr:DegT/DnrJ/EryC1/StrS family aminotransferase [Planctomycetota bacterium]
MPKATANLTDELAIHGGPKAKTTPYGTGSKYGPEEEREVIAALRQGTLFYAFGQKTKALCSRFSELYGLAHATATSSGTAAIHVALGCAGVGPGDEVIVTPITDMGSVIGILYQGAVPVFADMEPYTFAPDPESIAARITDRTRAIVVVHLAGNPAKMDRIMAIARERGVAVIEDCAQAWLTEYQGRKAGTFGAMGCFSLNEFKHISAGDGGLVGTNNPELARLAALWADKCYDRTSKVRDPWFLAPNYRMNELTAAVSLAQLEKAAAIVERRSVLGRKLTAGITGLPGVVPLEEQRGGRCSFWFYMFRIDPAAVGVGRDEFVAALKAEGVACEAGYIQDVVYKYRLFREKSAFPHSRWPFEDPRTGKVVEYPDGLCPTAEEIIRTCVWMPLNQWFTDRDVEEAAAGIAKVARHFAAAKGGRA